MLTTYNPGASETKVYTPFPDYEVTDPPTGANVTRTTYRLGGQIAALRVNDGATNKLYYPLTDHLGNVMALSDVDGNFVSGSDARYDPFGVFTTTPTTNPSVSNLGFTGHRHNNTGTNNLGLIYMNARYYLPEVGRFISADSIVPEPENPQSYNRYGYTRNNPVNLIDPTGNKECGTDSGCKATVPHATPFQTYLYLAWLYYKTFDRPIKGELDISQKFILKSATERVHDGIDLLGTFSVYAPSDGKVLRASSSTAAGMWQIQNIKTGEVMEWSIYPDHPGYQGKLTTNDRGEDGLYLPERLLAPNEQGDIEWVDIAPDWSHETGTEIRIQHSYGLQTVYYHTTPSVEKDMQVNQGDLLGVTANTGYSTGIHLHYTLEFTYGNVTIALNPLVPPAQIAHLFP